MDTNALLGAARRGREASARLRHSADRVRSIEDLVWSGRAGDAFRREVRQEAASLHALADRVDELTGRIEAVTGRAAR